MFQISITAFRVTTPIEEAIAELGPRGGIAVVLGPDQGKLVSIDDLIRARSEGRKVLAEVAGTPMQAVPPIVGAQDLASAFGKGIIEIEANDYSHSSDERPSLLVTFYICNKDFTHWYTPQQYAALNRDQAGNRLCRNQDGGIVS